MKDSRLGVVHQPLYGTSARLRGVVLHPAFATACDTIRCTPERMQRFTSYVRTKLGPQFVLPRSMIHFHGDGMLLQSLRVGENWRHRLELESQSWRGGATKDVLVYLVRDDASPASSETREWLLGVFGYWVEYMFIEQLDQQQLQDVDCGPMQ